MDDHGDATLWKRFQTGNEQAFTEIYTTYFPVLYHYGYHIARDESLVKDCIQTVFVELWKSRQNLATTTSIKYYLLKVMRRKVYLSLHKEAMYGDLSIDAEAAEVSFSPELDLITRQTADSQQHQLQEAIAHLSNRQKEAITLLYIEGLSYPEVSAIMTLKVRSVYNLVHTALESLRKHLNQPGLWALLALLIAA